MSVTIKGTDTSAAAPSFTGSDGDTGLYFPAAGQAAIATNGVQGLLVDENQAVRINGASAATSDSKVNTQVNSAGSLITLAEFRNLDYTAGTKSFLRVRNQVSAGGSYSSYFGQGQDGKTYIIANNSARGGDIVIDGNTGYVSTPAQPAFQAFYTGGNPSVGVIVFNNTNLNIGSNYSTSTGRFTAPVAGRYYFSTVTGYLTPTGTSVFIRKNGTNILGLEVGTSGSGWWNLTGSLVIEMSTNDYVDIYLNNTNWATFDGGVWNSFSGYLLG